MEDERIRKIVAGRLTAYRKRAGFTQAELAEKVNYSDKSVSKWERGDGLPDLLVLCRLAELYEIPVDEFLHEGPLKRPACEQRRRHWLVFLLSVGLTFLIAGIVFYIFTVLSIPYAWLSFIGAVVVSAILAVVFSHIWAGTLLQGISVSVLVWSVAVLIFLLLHLFAKPLSENGLLFSLAGGMQVLVLLWYLLQHHRAKNKMKGI